MCRINQSDIKLPIQKLLKTSVLDNRQNQDFVIPPLLHYIYIDYKNRDIDSSKFFINIIDVSVKKLTSYLDEWKTIIWVLYNDHVKELNKYFSHHKMTGLQVKTFEELTHYSSFTADLFHSIYLKDIANIISADALRWLVVYEYGGFYIDLDYEILSPSLFNDLRKFDFVLQCGDHYIMNNFIGSKKNYEFTYLAFTSYIKSLANNNFLKEVEENCYDVVNKVFTINNFSHVMSFGKYFNNLHNVFNVLLLDVTGGHNQDDNNLAHQIGIDHLSQSWVQENLHATDLAEVIYLFI